MPFRPSVNDTLTVDGVVYRFTEHPAARNMPYGQSGRKGTVYQLQEQDDREHALHALKVFVRAHREPRIATVAERLRQFAGLPGLAVCDREAITPERHAALLASEPDLTYAVLMPWIAGTTWQEIVLGRQPLKEAQSREIAQRLALILATMEAQEIAHCDLSGPNVMVALRAQPGPAVQLVDVEDLYAPGLPVPARPSSGSAGYGHREGAESLWRADADRFAGAVLLAEMLGWWDNTVRVIAAGESYFDADELQQHGERFQVLVQSLGSKWGAPVADLFSRAWHSASLADCPTFAEWSRALGTPEVESKERPARRRLEEAEKLTARGDTEGAIRALEEANRLAPELAALPYVHALQRRAEARERASDVAGALADYRAAHAAAPPGAHRNELADIVRLIQSQLPASAPVVDDTEAAETEAARLQAEAAARAAEAARWQAVQEAEAREQAAREQAAREQAAREQAAHEQAAQEEAARQQAEEQARREAALAAERAAAEARRAAEEEARRNAEAEARRAAEEQARREAERAAEIQAEQRREAEARQQAAELEQRRAAEAEALRRREQEAREAAAVRQQQEAVVPPGPRPWPRPLVALAVVVILVANFILFGVLSSRSASSAPAPPSFVAAQTVQGPAPALPVA